MMHLVSSRKEIEKPSDFELACRILKDVLRQEPDCNFLWTDGRWQPADYNDIMRRANSRLKSLNRPQFDRKREWLA